MPGIHISITNGHGGDGAAHRENWNGPVVLQPASTLPRSGDADEGANLKPPWPASDMSPRLCRTALPACH